MLPQITVFQELDCGVPPLTPTNGGLLQIRRLGINGYYRSLSLFLSQLHGFADNRHPPPPQLDIRGRGSCNYLRSYSPVESCWTSRFSAPVLTGPGVHPDSYTMGTGYFPGVKRPKCGVHRQPQGNAGVKERVELYLYYRSGSSWPVLGLNLTLLFTPRYYNRNPPCCSVRRAPNSPKTKQKKSTNFSVVYV
jgi:hypothetical protein